MAESSQPIISIIVARAANGVIGVRNKLPWRLSNDLKYFKKVTMGKPVIMGRKTFDSIGKPLPGRTNVVVTRNPGWHFAGCFKATSLQDAVAVAMSVDAGAGELVVAGGAGIYQQALSLANRIYLTEVHATVAGDTVFPPLSADWQELSREKFNADDNNQFDHDMVVLVRA